MFYLNTIHNIKTNQKNNIDLENVVTGNQNPKHLPQKTNHKLIELINRKYSEFGVSELDFRVNLFLNQPSIILLRNGVPISSNYYLEVFPINKFEVQYKNLIKSKHFQILSEDDYGQNYVLRSNGLEKYLKNEKDFKIYVDNLEVGIDILLDRLTKLDSLTLNHIFADLINFYHSNLAHVKINNSEIKIRFERNIYDLRKNIQNLKNKPQ